MEAVTQFLPAWRQATMAAISSMYLMMAPPKTFPRTLASVGIMSLVVVISDSEGRFGARGAMPWLAPAPRFIKMRSRRRTDAEGGADPCRAHGELRLSGLRREKQGSPGRGFGVGGRADRRRREKTGREGEIRRRYSRSLRPRFDPRRTRPEAGCEGGGPCEFSCQVGRHGRLRRHAE